jgi:hypothetical protein
MAGEFPKGQGPRIRQVLDSANETNPDNGQANRYPVRSLVMESRVAARCVIRQSGSVNHGLRQKWAPLIVTMVVTVVLTHYITLKNCLGSRQSEDQVA